MKKLLNNGLLISILFFVCTVTIFGPLELYVANSNEFWFSFTDILSIFAVLALLSFIVLYVIGKLFHGKGRDLYAVILFAVTLCLYIQGNYANMDYGTLDGTAIDWNAYTGYAVVDTLGWILLIAIIVLLWKKKTDFLHKAQKILSLFIIAIQLLTLGYLTLSTNVFADKSNYFLSTEGMYEISENENIIIFILDAFDDAYFQKIYADDSETYDKIFEDFTYFDNTTVAAARTKAALPTIITGEAYPGDISYIEYIENAFDRDGLYTQLQQQNYHTGIYTDSVYIPDNAGTLVDNQEDSGYKVSSYSGLAGKYLEFTLFKYMPHVLKQFFWMYTGEFEQYKIGSYITDDASFYKDMQLSLMEDGNAFRLYHLHGAHSPYTLDENAQSHNETTLTQQCKGALHIVSDYIEQMKDLGVYDNATIVIMADHGEANDDYGTINDAHGILFFKSKSQQSDFSFSSAPVSYFDLHATLLSALCGASDNTFFDYSEGEVRDRYFYKYTSDAGKFVVSEYCTNGHAGNADALRSTGRELAPIVEAGIYQFGTELVFGTDTNALPYIISGISGTDAGSYAWTCEKECVMEFYLESTPVEDLDIYMYMAAVMTDNGPQEIRIFANDVLCYETTREDSTPLEFKIPKNLVGETRKLTLRIELPNAISPLELYGGGHDSRHLGLALTAMYIIDSGQTASVAGTGVMDKITHIIGIPLTALLNACNRVLNNYVLAIFVFTFLTKVILLPVSLWTNKNGIIMIKMMPELNRLKVKYYGDKETISDKTQELYKREHYNPIASSVPMIIQVVLLMGVIDAVKQMLGSDTGSILNAVPTQAGGLTWLMPVLAALAALALGIGQNLLNPLQKEQTKKDQWFTNGISIAISLFLGAFVSVGTCVYWIASNLFTIPFQWLMNKIMDPKKYVDYEALEESRKDLAVLDSLKEEVSKEDKKRERADYKRFFSVANKHLVFYSEKSGFYKYFQNTIAYLLEHSNVIIHYVTNDPKDQIFAIAKSEPRIRPYYIGQQKIITLMMKMDADMVITTTHELDTYYLKRSYIRKDIEYIYIPHAMVSTNMTSNKGCVDNYDTVFCVGKHQLEELREAEAMYGTPVKNLIPVGYGMLDNMLEAYAKMEKEVHAKKRILVAPSWQEDNLLDSCIDKLVEQLYCPEHFVVVRPHPEYVKRFPGKVKALQDKFKDLDPELFLFETDFSSNVSIYTADMLITDWSGIVQEFCYTTKKPGLMINTPMKVMNPEYTRYKNPPLDISMRNILGKTLEMDELDKTRETVEELFSSAAFYEQQITDMTNEYVYNIGSSGSVGARYIIRRLMEKDAEREANKK